MGICSYCHQRKSIFAPKCHHCHEYQGFWESLGWLLFEWLVKGATIVGFVFLLHKCTYG